jgi:two-component system alkaline phosphatase synthesis response regulator PhoP
MGHAVLVVEDEREIRELLRRYLERAGLAVTTTGSGAEAVRLLEAGGLGLVVLDLGLPDVDGAEVLRAARAGQRVPVVVLTARSAVEDRIRGLESGADDYVTKPFSPTEVVLRVQAVLARGNTGGCPEISGPASFGHGRLRIDETRHEASLPTGAGGSGGPPGAAPEIRAHSIVGLQAPSPLPRRISPPEYASAQTVCRRHRDHVENSPGVLWRG